MTKTSIKPKGGDDIDKQFFCDNDATLEGIGSSEQAGDLSETLPKYCVGKGGTIAPPHIRLSNATLRFISDANTNLPKTISGVTIESSQDQLAPRRGKACE